jgi:hypothetical protein
LISNVWLKLLRHVISPVVKSIFAGTSSSTTWEVYKIK